MILADIVVTGAVTFARISTDNPLFSYIYTIYASCFEIGTFEVLIWFAMDSTLYALEFLAWFTLNSLLRVSMWKFLINTCMHRLA